MIFNSGLQSVCSAEACSEWIYDFIHCSCFPHPDMIHPRSRKSLRKLKNTMKAWGTASTVLICEKMSEWNSRSYYSISFVDTFLPFSCLSHYSKSPYRIINIPRIHERYHSIKEYVYCIFYNGILKWFRFYNFFINICKRNRVWGEENHILQTSTGGISF